MELLLTVNVADDVFGRIFLSVCVCVSVLWLTVWRSGNTLVSINEVNLHRAWLVLGWVTVSGVQLPVQEIYLSI